MEYDVKAGNNNKYKNERKKIANKLPKQSVTISLKASF